MTIQIPDKAEEVVVHAPENFGPADSQGRSVLKPIFRQERSVSTVQIFGIGLFVVLGIAMTATIQYIVMGRTRTKHSKTPLNVTANVTSGH